MRVAISLCMAVQVKLKQAADWMRVIRDCGLYLLSVEDILPTFEKVNKKVTIDQVR